MKILERIAMVAAIVIVVGAGCGGSATKTSPDETQRTRIYPGSLPYVSPTTPPPNTSP